MRYSTHGGRLMLAVGGCLAVSLSSNGACATRQAETRTAPAAVETQPAAPHADGNGNGNGAGKTSALPDRAAIQAAVRAVLDEQPAIPRLHEADTLRANQYDRFSRQVEEATVPDCLHADGLKRQPTFFLSGLLALPFIAVAKVRGKCQ